MGVLEQKSTKVISGQVQSSQTGTPGKHLLSASIGMGLKNDETQTNTRIGYTGHFQKYNHSHEVMLDVSRRF
jgi:hypothetical protein